MPAVIRRRRLIAAGANSGWRFGWVIMSVAGLRFAATGVHGAVGASNAIAYFAATGAAIFVLCFICKMLLRK